MTLLNCSCSGRSGLCVSVCRLSVPLPASLPAQDRLRHGNQVVSVGRCASLLGKALTSSSVTWWQLEAVFPLFSVVFYQTEEVSISYFAKRLFCLFVCLAMKECWMLLNAFSVYTEMIL